MHGDRLIANEQPSTFRTKESTPDWVHLPKLRLLLGWGPGLREAFGASLLGLRTVIIPEQAGILRPSLKWLMTWYDDYFLLNTPLRENAPPLTVFSAGAQYQRYLLDDNGLRKVPLDFSKQGCFPVSSSRDFGVRYAVDDVGSAFVVSHRVRRLKEKYQERMKKFGLVYASGTGKRSLNANGLRTPNEHRFANFLSAIKETYVEKRIRELEQVPGTRPPDYDDRRKAQIRSRLGEIERGKRDRDGKRKRPFTEEALTRRTCAQIAHRESDDEMFDFSWNNQCSFRLA